MKNFLIKQWQIIYHTTYGKIVYALFFTVLFQFLADQFNSDILGKIGLGFFLYIIFISLKLMLYAWIINPIRELKKKGK